MHFSEDERTKFSLRHGDLLVCEGGEVGRTALWRGSFECYFQKALHRLRPLNSQATSEFMLHFMRFAADSGRLADFTSQSSIAHLTREKLAQVEVLLPPLAEQRKIAAILSSVDDAIEASQAVIDQLQVVKEAMMAELLTKGLPGRHKKFKNTEIGVVPEEWRVLPLSDLAAQIPNAIVDGPFGSNLKSAHYRTSGIPVIQSGFVTTGEWEPRAYVYVDQALFDSQRRSAVYPNDIVMAKIGANAGACARMPPEHSVGILAGNSIKITPGPNAGGQFLLHLMQHALATGRLNLLRSTTAQPAISLRSLKELLLVCPPKPEQDVIAGALDSTADRIRVEAGNLAGPLKVKSALMSVLLTGEVRVRVDKDAAA